MVRPLGSAEQGLRRWFAPAAAVGFALFLVAVIYAANQGIRHPGHLLVEALPYGDKFGHAGLWGAMTVIGNLAVRRWVHLSVGPARRLPVPLVSLVLCVIVSMEEASQFFFANRTLDAVDLLANFVGITLGSLIFRLFVPPPGAP